MKRLGCLLASMVLLSALPGCGGRPVLQPQSTAPSASPAGTMRSARDLSLNVVAIDGPGSQERGRIRCPMWIDRRDEVELASERLSLTGDQAAQLKQQWMAFRQLQTTAMPSVLRQVPGAPTSAPMPRPPVYPSYAGTNYFWGPGCALLLQITNTGSNPVSIMSSGLRLTSASTANGQHYNLVDRCSLEGTPPESCHPELGGGPAYCSVYSAQVLMAPGGASALYRDQPLSRAENGPCPSMTIGRRETKELWIEAVGVQPQIYAVVPELEVQTSRGTSTLSLPELAGTLAFADPSQFSCYKLVGSSFVEALDGEAIFPAIDPRTGLGAWRTTGVWCL